MLTVTPPALPAFPSATASQPFRLAHRLRRGGAGQQHRELLAAEAEQLAARLARKDRGYGHQHLVAPGVAEPVVHLLEVVQVHHQQRRGVSTPRRGPKHTVHAPAVEGPRQRVAHGLLHQLVAERIDHSQKQVREYHQQRERYAKPHGGTRSRVQVHHRHDGQENSGGEDVGQPARGACRRTA
jgi:hypothetical protein